MRWIQLHSLVSSLQDLSSKRFSSTITSHLYKTTWHYSGTSGRRMVSPWQTSKEKHFRDEWVASWMQWLPERGNVMVSIWGHCHFRRCMILAVECISVLLGSDTARLVQHSKTTTSFLRRDCCVVQQTFSFSLACKCEPIPVCTTERSRAQNTMGRRTLRSSSYLHCTV